MTQKRVLPKNVYDTLEFTALAYKGIGGGSMFVYDAVDREWTPFCALGHAWFLASPVAERALQRAGISTTDNDLAVDRINRGKGTYPGQRVSFPEWCAELGVVRGA